MFNSLRKRIMLMVVGTAVLILAILLGVVYASSYASLRNQNMAMLDRYVDIYSLENLPENEDAPLIPPGMMGTAPEAPPASDESRGSDSAILDSGPEEYVLSSFYSVSFDDAGDTLFVDEGKTGLYSRSRLVEMATDVVQRDEASGSTGALLYEIAHRDGYTLVAFIDNSYMSASMRTLLVDMLISASVAILLVFFLSFPLSRALVRPLEEDDALQRRFISDAGHELKTPISVIGVNADLLSRQLGENQWLDNIRHENQRMGELVARLLDLSRAQGGGGSGSELDLSQLVRAEAAPFESVAHEAGLELVCSIEDGLRVRGDAAQLAQLLSILIDNAICYSRGGSRVELSLRSERHVAVIEVVNRAEDLDARSLDHAFERFYRADETRYQAEGHYGLGLPIAKAIAESHGGDIALAWHDGAVRATAQIPLVR